MSIEVDTSSIEAFVAGFANMQKSSLEFLMSSTEKLSNLREAIEQCGNKKDGETLQVLQYVSALSLKGLEDCFNEYNAYKDKWLPAVSAIREKVDIPNATESVKKSAATLVKLIQGMQVIISSIMSVSDQYKYLAEEANVRFEATAGAMATMAGKNSDEEGKSADKQLDNSEEQREDESNDSEHDSERGKDHKDEMVKQEESESDSEKQETDHISYLRNAEMRVGTSSPGPRPEERAQLRRGIEDQDIGVSELSEELERPQTAHEDEQLRGDLRIGCARLATAREEQNYLSYSIRNEKRVTHLRKEIQMAKMHSDELDKKLFKLLSIE